MKTSGLKICENDKAWSLTVLNTEMENVQKKLLDILLTRLVGNQYT